MCSITPSEKYGRRFEAHTGHGCVSILILPIILFIIIDPKYGEGVYHGQAFKKL
jgi:hypothetical protein